MSRTHSADGSSVRRGSTFGQDPPSHGLTAMDPNQDTTAAFKVVCDSHGVLPEDCADYTVATIIEEEHAEDCPAKTQILPSDSLEFETAKELVEQEQANDRDGPDRGLEEFQDESSCSVCGGSPEIFCCACGAEAGGAA